MSDPTYRIDVATPRLDPQGSGASPSEFDLRASERKLACGCYADQSGDTWRVTGQAFLCPVSHRLQDRVEDPRV